MFKKNYIIGIVIAVLLAGGAFWGGIKYGQSKNSGRDWQSLSAEQRQRLLQQFRTADNSLGGRRSGVAGSEFINGEIIAQDDKTITVKLRDGSAKIIFVSAITNIDKTIAGTASDLAIGKQVMVNGSANSDGSLTAQGIEIRPNLPAARPPDNSLNHQPEEVKTFTVAAKNYSFSPAEIKVKRGDKVKVIIDNQEGFHDWVIDEFNAKIDRLSAGNQAVVEFVADKAGRFEFYCSVANHRQMGMRGTLIVE